MDPESPNSYLPMPPSPLGALPGMAGMMNPFWPMMQMPGMQGRLPHPLGFSPRFNPQMMGLGPLGIKTEDSGLKSPPTSSSASGSANILKCNFCSFIATSREILTSHIVKLHAMDNKDLFSMFGLSSEALLEESQKRRAPHQMLSPPAKMPRLSSTAEIQVKKEIEEFSGRNGHEKSHREPMNVPSMYPYINSKYGGQQMKDEGMDILKQMTLKFGSGPVDMKTKVASSSASIPSVSKAQTMMASSDGPLDLTKPRNEPAQSSLQQYAAALQKYSMEVAEELSSGDNSNYSTPTRTEVSSPMSRHETGADNPLFRSSRPHEVASPPARKRSRKGQAFKLDTLCMKLQAQQGRMYGSEDDEISDNEMDEMYSADLMMPIRYTMKNGSADEEDDDKKDAEEMEAEKKTETIESQMKKNGNDIKDEGVQEKAEKDEKRIKEEVDEGTEEGADDIDGELKVAMMERRTNAVIADTDSLRETEMKKLHYKLAFLNEQMDSNENKMANEDNGSVSNVDSDSQSGEDSTVDEKRNVRKSISPPISLSQNRRKQIPAAIQRGADIAWKMLNDPTIGDPSKFLDTRNNGQKLEMTPLDKKLWYEAPDCTKSLGNPDADDFECPHCKISFGDCIMYTMHMGYHGYKDPYKCNMCGDTCKDRVEFFLHIARAAHH